MFGFKDKSLREKILFILGIFFSLFYLALGLLFVFYSNMPFDMLSWQKYGFEVILIVYAIYRLVRLLRNT